MFGFLAHAYRLALSKRREAKKRSERSPRWRHVEKQHLALHPTCAACGSRKHVQVHHVTPFNTNPKLELDFANLLSLCMDRHECHLRIGHGGSFSAYSKTVVADAALVLAHPDQRPRVEAMAKARRLANEPGGA